MILLTYIEIEIQKIYYSKLWSVDITNSQKLLKPKKSNTSPKLHFYTNKLHAQRCASNIDVSKYNNIKLIEYVQ